MQEFTLARLFLEFSAVKSAVMIEWHGEGSDAHRCDMAQNWGNKLEVPNGVATGILDVVQSYKHLGSACNSKMQTAPDVARRCGIAFHDFHIFRQRVFSNPDISKEAKAAVAVRYLIPKQAFNVGTWPELNASAYNKYKKPYMAIMRAAAGREFVADKRQ